jgi:hypothetical protein
MRQLHIFLSRGNRRPLPDRGSHCRPTLSANLSICPQVQRGPTPRQPRQTRAHSPDTREPHLGRPPNLLHAATLRFLHHILQTPTPFRFLELLTCRMGSRSQTVRLARPRTPHGQHLRSLRLQVDIAQPVERGRVRCQLHRRPLPVIKYMGGWAKNSSVTEGKYIDPTMTPPLAAWRFFGSLSSARPVPPATLILVVEVAFGFKFLSTRALGLMVRLI